MMSWLRIDLNLTILILTIIKRWILKLLLTCQVFIVYFLISLYRTIYNMCTKKPPHDYSQQMYDKYRESFEEYITSMFYIGGDEETQQNFTPPEHTEIPNSLMPSPPLPEKPLKHGAS